MMPGRINGKRTRRRKRAFPGKVARSSASAASRPRVNERATLPAATIRLFTTASQIGASPKSWRYQSSVRWREEAPTPSRLKNKE